MSLRVRELDEHGVTAFITNPDYRVGFTVEQYESELRKAVDAGELDIMMFDYLLGKDTSGLGFNGFTLEQLEKFEIGIHKLNAIEENSKVLSDEFKQYISSQYDKITELPELSEQLGEGHD